MDAVAEATSAQELEATLLKKALLETLKERQQIWTHARIQQRMAEQKIWVPSTVELF